MPSAARSAKKNNLTVGKKIDFGYVFGMWMMIL